VDLNSRNIIYWLIEMKKAILVLVILASVLFLFGCVEKSPDEIVRANDEVNHFLSENPDAEITIRVIEPNQVDSIKDEIYCLVIPNTETLYFVELQSKQANLKWKVLVRKELQPSHSICINKESLTVVKDDFDKCKQGNGKQKILFIGNPSNEERQILVAKYDYEIKTVSELALANELDLQQYSTIILNQSNESDKSISKNLGDNLQNFVSNCGNLIVVLNSGTYQEGNQTFIGWKPNFSDLLPVDCVLNKDYVATCSKESKVDLNGRVWGQDFNHPIFNGIEVIPVMGSPPVEISTFEVQTSEGAKTIAYIKDERAPKTYFGISEKKQNSKGIVIYFNYNPGLTPVIFDNTLTYLN
jgi:hypothetical protein